LALGILALLLSVVTSGPLQILTMLVPLAILGPLIPVQGAFVASVSRLPGILPSFLTVLLPSLGFYGLIHLLPAIPESALNLLGVVALITALYGSLLALSQDSMDTLLAYAQMALGGILWWYLATSQSVSSGAVAYLGGLSLVTCGLFLASHSIRTRFGHLDLRTSHGLANIMPCLSTLFVLFITAALGLPMFTLFSAFMEMLLGMSSTPVGSLMVVLLIWLMASWYFPRLMQQVLFGRPSPQCKASHDLYVYERFSLILLLALLIILGMAPSTWFGATDPTPSMAQLTLGISQE